MRNNYNLVNFKILTNGDLSEKQTLAHYHHGVGVKTSDGKYCLTFELVTEALVNVGHGRFLVQKHSHTDSPLSDIDFAELVESMLGMYQIHADGPLEGIGLYTRDVFREAARLKSRINLLVDKDGTILRAEIPREEKSSQPTTD